MSIVPVIINLKDQFQWEGHGIFSSGTVRQMVVFDPVRNKHFMISENTGLSETLVFQCKKSGDITDYGEVGGGRGLTLEEVFGEFDSWMFNSTVFNE